MSSNKKREWFTYLLLVLYVFSGIGHSLTATSPYMMFVLITVAIFAIISTHISDRFPIAFSATSLLFLLFSFFVFVSAIVNKELEILIVAIGSFCLYILSQIFSNRLRDIDKYLHHLLIICSCLYLFIMTCSSIIFLPINSGYQGIFGNSNGTGLVSCTVYSVCISYLLYAIIYKQKISNKLKILLIITISVSIYFILCSRCRNALFCSLILTFFAIIFLLYYSSDDLIKLIKRFLILLFVVVLVLFIIEISPLSSFIDSYISKHQHLSSDLSNGRFSLWSNAIENFNFWGNGKGGSTSTHNTYLSMLDQYGFLPSLFFFIFMVYDVVKFLFSCFNKKDSNVAKFYLFFVFINFFWISLFESYMNNTLPMLLCVLCIGMIDEHRIAFKGASMKTVNKIPAKS